MDTGKQSAEAVRQARFAALREMKLGVGGGEPEARGAMSFDIEFRQGVLQELLRSALRSSELEGFEVGNGAYENKGDGTVQLVATRSDGAKMTLTVEHDEATYVSPLERVAAKRICEMNSKLEPTDVERMVMRYAHLQEESGDRVYDLTIGDVEKYVLAELGEEAADKDIF